MPPLPDIPRGRFRWIREPSQGWVERALQERIVRFLVAFGEEHGWTRASTVQAEERFADNGVNVRVPFGPTGPPQRKDNFMQRLGTPLVIISCERIRDGRRFEVALPFLLGNDIHPDSADVLLAAARDALRAQEKNAR